MNLRPSGINIAGWPLLQPMRQYEKNTVATAKLAIESRRYMTEFAHAEENLIVKIVAFCISIKKKQILPMPIG